MFWRATVLASALSLSACSGQLSDATIAPLGQPNGIIYPLTEEQADLVLRQAMVSEFPDTPITNVTIPNKGYTATIHFMTDSHTFLAVMIPGKGVDVQGSIHPGYSFQVSHSGTFAITGPKKAADLFSLISQDATRIAAPTSRQ